MRCRGDPSTGGLVLEGEQFAGARAMLSFYDERQCERVAGIYLGEKAVW
jgi:hypothetical protein